MVVAWCSLFRKKVASEHELPILHGQESRSQQFGLNSFRPIGIVIHGHGGVLQSTERLKAPAVLFPLGIIPWGDVHASPVQIVYRGVQTEPPIARPGPENDHLAAFCPWRRRPEDAIDRAEHGRVRADAERHDQNHGPRKRRVPAEKADCETKIAEQGGEEVWSPCGLRFGSMILAQDGAQLAAKLAPVRYLLLGVFPRVLRSHSHAERPFVALLELQGEFLDDLRFMGARNTWQP